MNSSHAIYKEALCSSLGLDEFKVRMANILQADPFFIPARLELLWFAQMIKDATLVKELMEETLAVSTLLYRNKEIQQRAIAGWTALEFGALLQWWDLYIHHTKSIRKRWVAQMYKKMTPNLFPGLPDPFTVGGQRYVVKSGEVGNMTALQTELQRVPAHAWSISTSRAMTIAYHQDTHSLLLRLRPEDETVYKPVDGVHESYRSTFADYMPQTYETVMRFASEHRLGLGRIAVVRLAPYMQAYRHFDGEKHLVGRNRYHLVLDSGKTNILSAGDEIVNVKPGEIWLFDNKIMHRAYNGSSTPRVHVIFDGYPLGK